MRRRRAISPSMNDFMERSLIVCLALVAIVALNFLYARKALAAEFRTAGQLLVAQVQQAPEPDLTEPSDPEDVESTNIDDTIVPPVDGPQAIAPTSILPITENSLLAKLHEVNQMEMQMGQLAKDSAEADIVKRYGHRVMADHRYVDQRLLNLAEGMEMDLTASLIPVPSIEKQEHAAQMATLSSTAGATFDGTFLEMMEKGHRDAIDLLMNGRNQLPVDSKVRLFAGQIIPILQQHLDVVSSLQGRKF